MFMCFNGKHLVHLIFVVKHFELNFLYQRRYTIKCIIIIITIMRFRYTVFT